MRGTAGSGQSGIVTVIEAAVFSWREIPVYGLIGVIGVCLALAYALFSCTRYGLSRDDTAYIFVFGAIGAMVGAKVLYLIVSAGDIYGDITSGAMTLPEIAVKYMSGGMVFYGGLIGAFIVSRHMALRYKKDPVDFLPVLVPAFALAHGISRIGCLLVGCCYGMESDGPLSIVYTSSQIAPNGVPLIPVQAVEAAGEIAIFLILAMAAPAVRRRVNILYAYIVMYASMRFVLEFFRGDEVRGHIAWLSVSQWISLLMLAAVSICVVAAGRSGKCGHGQAAHEKGAERRRL